MKGFIKNIGGSTFIKLPKDGARKLNLIDGTQLEIELKRTSNFLWAKGKDSKLSAQKFKDDLKKENFW